MVGEILDSFTEPSLPPLVPIDQPLQHVTTVLQRPIRLYDMEWAPTTRSTVAVVDLDNVILSSIVNQSRNAGYSGIRFDVEVLFEFLCPITTAGLVRVAWTPTVDPSSLAAPVASTTGKGALPRETMAGITSQYPGIDVDINTTTSATLVVPWNICQAYWPVHNAPDMTPPLGRVWVIPLTIPTKASGGTNARIRAWARPINIKAYGSIASPGNITWTKIAG